MRGAVRVPIPNGQVPRKCRLLASTGESFARRSESMKKLSLSVPENPAISPLTGWTRRHWEEVFFTLMKGIVDNASPGGARQRIPGPRSLHGLPADELEGFSRSLFMAGPWLNTAESGMLTFDGETIDVLEFCRRGILAGTNPKHPEYWGRISSYSQHLVECAALSWGLFLSRKKIWDQFSPHERKQVAGYLFQCTKAKYCSNNWLLFNVVTNAVLKRLGMPYSQSQIDKNLRRCDAMYRGNGWYCDGSKTSRYDYYNNWGFHFYHLLWVIIDGDSKPDTAEVHKQRVRLFARSFRYFFSGDGSTPCWGRSMIYRFGYLSPITLGQYLRCLDITPGEVKTMCNSTMKFYCDHPILTDRNHLSMGWLRPCEFVLERYSSGGSPLWATKSFALLLIPPEDPFWTTPEEPLPIHRGNFSVPLKEPGLLLIGTRNTGHVQIVSQQPYHDDPRYNAKYTNFAYSSIFSYEARAIYGSFNCDNSLSFSRDGIHFRQRSKTENLFCETDFAAAKYPMSGVDDKGIVYTWILVKDDFMVNFHRVEPAQPHLVFREGGYPLGYDEGSPTITSVRDAEMATIGGKLTFIRNLFGYTRQYKARPFADDVCGSNSRHHQSVVPVLEVETSGTQPFYLASMVYGTVGNDHVERLASLVREFNLKNNTARIEFYDGERVFLQIGEIANTQVLLNGKCFTGAIVVARASADEARWFVLERSGRCHTSDSCIPRQRQADHDCSDVSTISTGSAHA
jgi:hypothetical protein